ncbi:MAG: chromosome segregation protein SMC [Eubacterium sp.]|nr:chromosome segregation protein SMC [Eubacterium sp.]
MYLKKLALNGFKSFAEPVELEFSRGVSAIVGPNGSGKSNITDAIRWVLGEQSTKSLRGKKMEDVIFSGTEQKKAQGYAEVTLTLDNSSGYIADQLDEIVITRRLFRSGDSEYRMNQKSCKLKDIHELFMDTGLGKNGYSLISQGGIENIINSSPLELRRIVEEAVGIVNYKTKKQEAERKLAHTQDNIERLSDILEEIEKQLKPLKNQSEKAKAYLEIREELKKVDLMIFKGSMEEADGRLEDYARQLKDLKFEIFEVEKRSGEQDLKFQQTKAKIRGLLEKTQEITADIDLLKEKIQAAERAHIIASGKIENERDKDSRFLREMERYEKEKARHLEALALLMDNGREIKERLDEKLEVLDKLKGEQAECSALLEAEKEKQADTLKKKADAESRKSQLGAELLELKGSLVQWSTQKSFYEERMEKIRENCQRGETLLEEIAVEAEQNEKTRQRLELEHRGALEKSEAAQKEITRLREAWQVLENNIKVNVSKRDYLKNIQKNYSDYFPSIRAVMNSREHLGEALDKVYGPVGELLSVPEKYTLAVDIALGAKSQNIVVEDVSTANRCIGILKNQRAGRATFLPLDNLRYSVIEGQDLAVLKKQAGFEGVAAQMVDYAPRFKRVVESLLGRIVIARDFDAGRQIQKAIHGRYTIVTLEGELFYPGGAIVGGYSKSGKQSPLSKKAEIDKIEAEIKAQEAEKLRLQELGQKALKAHEVLKEACKKAELRLNSVAQEAWQIQKNREDAEAKMAEERQIEAEFTENSGSFEEKTMTLEEAIARKQQELQALEAAFDEEDNGSQEYIEALRASVEGVNRKISDARIDLARDQESERALKQQMTMVEGQAAQCGARIAQLQSDLEASRGDQAAKKETCDRLKVEIETHQAAVQEKEGLLAEVTAQSEAGKKDSEQLEEEIRQLNHTLILKNEAKSSVEIAKGKLELQVEHWEENIRESYDMNLLMARDYCAGLSAESVDTRPENQRRLKGMIADMGHINVNAIEEYASLNERHSFMSGQYEDLTKAKAELEEIIANLYQSMEKQFQQKFAELQKKFTRIFGILFEGGKAQIEYTDPDNVLESGIELVAQPPGKNLRHISLLSGGEKSMIAISLLFSFIELNPSPFCVIDEIDAALDDHNIYRFTKYLERIARENQFIIITHRKSTLEACDAIYGVSMAKNGVSKLVSVRLSDYVEPAV